MGLLIFLALNTSCRKERDSSFTIDPKQGTFHFLSFEFLGPEMNGVHALKEAFIFSQRDCLVAINSVENSDLIVTMKGDSAHCQIRFSVVNASDTPQTIGEVNLFSLVAKDQFLVREIGPAHAGILRMGTAAACLDIRTAQNTPWDPVMMLRDDTLLCKLPIEHAPLVLLPGEKLDMPALEFFYHLCPE